MEKLQYLEYKNKENIIMKKIILILTLMLALPVFSQELQCGVAYDVNSARSYVQEGQESDIGQQSNLYYDGVNPKDVDIIYEYNSNGVPISFNVLYKDDLKRDYIYKMDNKLLYVNKYDKDVTIFPHRAYTYTPNGKLVHTSLIVSKGNCFVFLPNGKLLARVVNSVYYLGNTNIVVGSQSNY